MNSRVTCPAKHCLGIYTWMLLLVCSYFTSALAEDKRPNAAEGLKITLSEFTSTQWPPTSVDGKPFVWNDRTKAHVVCFLGCECPVARFYAARLERIWNQYREQGIEFVGVMSNSHDSIEDIQKFSKELGLTFPLIRDTNQQIARNFRATRTAEIVVLRAGGKLIYRGRVDDQMSPGIKRSEAKYHELVTILKDIDKLDTAPFSTEPVGCLLAFEKNTTVNEDVTYCRDVAPIFNRHCYECHRPGDIGPFDIGNYEEVRGWSEMIVEVIENKRMPPWHATGNHISLRNAREMQTAEIKTIQRWVAAGSPLGDTKEMPPVPSIRDGWRLPHEPDLIVSMRDKPYRIPASGSVEYQYFVVDPKLTEDKWISASQVIPGNASVVHHAIVFIRPPDGAKFKGISWLTAFVPGQRPMVFPEGYARLVPAGSKLVFQMHYTPNGTEQSDLTKIGMNFVDSSKVTNEVSTIIGIDQSFEIPPHTSNHTVQGTVNLPRDAASLLAVSPHMHLRGKSFLLKGVMTDGTTQTLLEVPRYDFNWQHTYELADPIPLSSLKQLEFDVAFDNSNENPFNPNPSEYVMWGDQTWEEMAVAFFEIASPRDPGITEKRVSKAGSPSESDRPKNDELSPQAVKWAEAYIARFDANADGKVAKSEVNDLVRRYSFHALDADDDLVLTREELAKSFEARSGR